MTHSDKGAKYFSLIHSRSTSVRVKRGKDFVSRVQVKVEQFINKTRVFFDSILMVFIE
ncbi:MAG TPA: hypothetical protein PK512_07430 [bacterium]|nr:hypothetical protein [bacterium]